MKKFMILNIGLLLFMLVTAANAKNYPCSVTITNYSQLNVANKWSKGYTAPPTSKYRCGKPYNEKGYYPTQSGVVTFSKGSDPLYVWVSLRDTATMAVVCNVKIDHKTCKPIYIQQKSSRRCSKSFNDTTNVATIYVHAKAGNYC